ncbi:hypothetical protein EMIHUDRAFT_201087 [Emiliania huxleyi CCMP1516]|uniref:Transmembrane protein n=2 Tax=Emiliania huxleyi TaxID=2903 RepID=A0A0D3KM48_EMIH1|nr:hypothetical protein EMIHUDRAFT_201087 [Emiliania huxleyi CCMP1516]EOD36833.1 hypothetical protein EMIHUDRAFT_201087 [Emiliania huxleyi CCMP1516]|eukprot:XP_005789262.1 hypothetical protein EMIHUDRAFT_201087 [Emiliania huxleyi CCMP1516]
MGMMRTTFWVGAVSCGLTLLQSGRLIAKHRRHWHNPQQQRCIVVIISSVPIFAVNAFVSLLILRGSKTVGLHAPEWLDLVLDGAKECYEAFGIWSFLELMLSYTGCVSAPNGAAVGVPDKLKGVEVHLPFPLPLFCGASHWTFDRRVADRLRRWAMQFVYVRPILAVLTITATGLGVYEKVWVWLPISVALNVSMTVALYSLLLFYHSFERELSRGNHWGAHASDCANRHQRPLAKFLCIKGVVMFCFWQGIVLQLLEAAGVVRAGHFFDLAERSTMIQDALVSLEMCLIFAPLHVYAFSADDYLEEGAPAGSPMPSTPAQPVAKNKDA